MRRRGFTLVEILVVIVIVGLVSVLVLPTVVDTLNHRQVGETARVVQAALAGARDAASRDGAPSGFRLMPDPAFPGIGLQFMPDGTTANPYAGIIDPTQPLAANRLVPIAAAPNYTTGVAAICNPGDYTTVHLLPIGATVLILEQFAGTGIEPTSWFWTVRVGDRVQINQAGPWYTVVGPMETGPSIGNGEQFVNVETAANYPSRIYGSNTTSKPITWEFLYLVNGRDDNADGYIDNGWDGVTTNYETETWLGTYADKQPLLSYTVKRRPVPQGNARTLVLPSGVVIDLTVGRSRLPVNPQTGTVDIMVNPDGSIVPSTLYSSPSSVGMNAAFYFFWLTERAGVSAPPVSKTPLPDSTSWLLSLFTRTGQISSLENPDPVQGFVQAMQNQ